MEKDQVMVKMVLDRWYSLIRNFDTAFSTLSDSDLQREISPGRNRGIYLLGHMIAVHDDMLRLLDFGEKQYSHLYETFIAQPDRAIENLPPIQELRANWAEQVNYMSARLMRLHPRNGSKNTPQLATKTLQKNRTATN